MNSDRFMPSEKVKVVNTGGGIGFFGLLTVLFVGLKLGGVISWPWLLVICPIFVPLAICLAILAIGLAIIAFAATIKGIRALFKWAKRRRVQAIADEIKKNSSTCE